MSELLAAMHKEWQQDHYADQRGVLLISQSGGGKTTSCWKAFYDCLFSTPDDGSQAGKSRPVLNKFTPCWLSLDQSFEAEGKSTDVFQFLLNETEKPADPKEYQHVLIRYLEQGPPLLIFADLNRVSPDRQDILAQAFKDFQSKYGRYGHRIVVTFRSTDADSSAMQALKSKNFGVYELVPLDMDEAKGYLFNLRLFEQELEKNILQQWGIRFTHRNVDEEQQLFEELAKKYLGRNLARQESIISTPLLMHFFSILPPGALDADTTLYQLYSAVIDQHFNREYTSYSSELSKTGLNEKLSEEAVREQLMIAMTRIALAIQSQGPDATHLRRERLRFLLSHPDQNAGTNPAWWSEDSYWNNSRIMTMQFNREHDPREQLHQGRMQIESILKFSLLRQNGKDVGFLHDSMLYYFCGAVALVEPDIPTLVNPIDELWCQRVVRRIDEQPTTWIYPAPFLASRLETMDRADNQLRNAIDPYQRLHLLLLHLIRYADSRAWLELLIRFTQHQREDDQLMKMIAWGLTASPGFLKKYPEQIPAELHRHLTLLQDKTENIDQFLQALDEST
ncbi:NACHT domain-containing protein [Gimesia maris]|uniref:NACHT domain-containing protein n=1 Tax=Gimesia maris TaxID=122 RepID=UPI0032ECA9ED